MATYLVTAATGKQGGATARELLAVGAKVNALVRDASKPEAKALEALGAVLFVGDFANEEAITKATAGVKGIFLNPFPDFVNPLGEKLVVERFIAAARAAGTVDTLVLSTSNWAPFHPTWLAENPAYPLKDFVGSKWEAEEALRSSGFKQYTILRPSWMVHNYALPHAMMGYPDFAATGKLRTAMRPDQPIAHLDAYDVGKFASAALLDPARFASKEITLAVGNVTLNEVGRELSEISGKEVPVEYVPAEEFMKDPSDMFSMMRGVLGMWTTFKGNTITEDQLALQKSFGIELTPVRQALERYKDTLVTTTRA